MKAAALALTVLLVPACTASDDGPGGARWHTIFEAGDIDIYSGQLGGIVAPSVGQVYVAGSNFLLVSGADRWTAIDAEDSGTRFWAVHPLQTGTVVAVGNAGVVSNFRNGITSDVAPRDVTLRGVWGTAEDDMWIVGGDTDAALFAPDTSFALDLVEHTPVAATGPLRAITGLDTGEVVAVGDDGVILEYDGSSWESVDSPTVASLRGVASGGGTTLAVGQVPAVVLERQRTSWVDITPTDLGGAPEAVAVSETGDAAIVGPGVRFRRVAGAWINESEGVPDLIDVAAAGSEVYAISESGALLQYAETPLTRRAQF